MRGFDICESGFPCFESFLNGDHLSAEIFEFGCLTKGSGSFLLVAWSWRNNFPIVQLVMDPNMYSDHHSVTSDKGKHEAIGRRRGTCSGNSWSGFL
jgi:hypothetical protein